MLPPSLPPSLPLTLQAMVHELLGLNNNRVSLTHAPGIAKQPELKEVRREGGREGRREGGREWSLTPELKEVRSMEVWREGGRKETCSRETDRQSLLSLPPSLSPRWCSLSPKTPFLLLSVTPTLETWAWPSKVRPPSFPPSLPPSLPPFLSFSLPPS